MSFAQLLRRMAVINEARMAMVDDDAGRAQTYRDEAALWQDVGKRVSTDPNLPRDVATLFGHAVFLAMGRNEEAAKLWGHHEGGVGQPSGGSPG